MPAIRRLKRTASDPAYKFSELGRLAEFFKQIVTPRLQHSNPDDLVYGLVESSTVRPGKVLIKLVTPDGVRYYTGSMSPTSADAQSDDLPDWGHESDGCDQPVAPTPEDLPTAQLWSCACNESLATHERLAALQELTGLESGKVAEYVAEQLNKDDLKDDWQDSLIFLTEQISFPVAERVKIGERLLSIATRLRQFTRAGMDKVVWSAMRRAATLLPPDPARFTFFLDRKGPIDTRAVALRCIQRMYEPRPPENPDVLRAVADRVDAFATKFLDPDVFASGENALISQNAIYALVALSDPRAEQAISRARDLNRRWMNRQLKTGPEQILKSWRSNGSLPQNHPALVRVEVLISCLD